MRDDFTLNHHWRIQPGLDRISSTAGEVQIPPKYMDVLYHLALQAGDVVARHDLLEGIWKDTVVVEESLTRAVSELRKLLDDDPRKPAIIETIPKKGYRLIGQIEWHRKAIDPSTVKAPLSARPLIRPRFQLLFSLAPAIVLALVFFLIRILKSDAPTASSIRLMPLTSYQGEESHPVLSPDGNRLAFRWNGESGYQSSIYVKIIGSEQPLRLTDAGFSTEPAWSPDGRFIVYIKNTDQGRALYSVPSLSGPERLLVENVYGARTPVWSPDGESLAFAYVEDPAITNSIYLYHLESQVLTRLTEPEIGHTIDSKPVFSKDGKEIAFIRTVDGQRDVYILSLHNRQVKRITRTNQWVTDVEWSPDDKSIIYSSREGIWKVGATGGAPAFLAAGGMQIDNISVARNSWRLAYQQAHLERNIWQIDLDPETGSPSVARRLISSSRVDDYPELSPNGRKLTFVSDRSGHPQVWMSEKDGSSPVRLTDFNGCIVARPTWGPRNRRLAFVAELYGNPDIFITDINGAKPRQLTKQSSREIRPFWSRDGRWVYFGSNRNQEWQIWKIPVRGGKAVQVTTEPGSYRPVESPDGKTLYFEGWFTDHYAIWKKSIHDGDENELIRLDSGFFDGWRLTQKGILFSKRDADRVLKFGFYDFETGETRELFRHVRQGFRFSASPDGRSLYFSQADRDESDIVLLDNFR